MLIIEPSSTLLKYAVIFAYSEPLINTFLFIPADTTSPFSSAIFPKFIALESDVISSSPLTFAMFILPFSVLIFVVPLISVMFMSPVVQILHKLETYFLITTFVFVEIFSSFNVPIFKKPSIDETWKSQLFVKSENSTFPVSSPA